MSVPPTIADRMARLNKATLPFRQRPPTGVPITVNVDDVIHLFDRVDELLAANTNLVEARRMWRERAESADDHNDEVMASLKADGDRWRAIADAYRDRLVGIEALNPPAPIVIVDQKTTDARADAYDALLAACEAFYRQMPLPCSDAMLKVWDAAGAAIDKAKAIES